MPDFGLFGLNVRVLVVACGDAGCGCHVSGVVHADVPCDVQAFAVGQFDCLDLIAVLVNDLRSLLT